MPGYTYTELYIGRCSVQSISAHQPIIDSDPNINRSLLATTKIKSPQKHWLNSAVGTGENDTKDIAQKILPLQVQRHPFNKSRHGPMKPCIAVVRPQDRKNQTLLNRHGKDTSIDQT